MKITREQLRLWCESYNKIAELVPEDGLTPLEVAALDIPAVDRLCVLLREEVVPARELRLLACDWAEAACHAAGWNDQRSLEAIAVARRYAVGEATEPECAVSASAALAARSEAWSSAKTAWSARAAAAEAAAHAVCGRVGAAWVVKSAVWSAAKTEEAAWSEQLADVAAVLKQIDEAEKDAK